MNLRKFVLPGLLWLPFVVASSLPQNAPKLTVTPQRVIHYGHTIEHGTGFTPKKTALSHLRRPDGTEFPVLPMLTDDKGEFSHDIDTMLLLPGTFELWAVDDVTKMPSNVVQFEVVLDKR